MTNWKKRQQGRKAKSVGDTFEKTIQFYAERIDHFVLVKQHPEVMFIGPSQSRVIGKGWADYFAAWDGLALTFEAKTTKNKQTLKPPEDTQHEFEALRSAAENNTPAFYLVEWRRHKTVTAHMVSPDDTWPFRMRFADADYHSSSDDNFVLHIVSKIIAEVQISRK